MDEHQDEEAPTPREWERSSFPFFLWKLLVGTVAVLIILYLAYLVVVVAAPA